METRSFFVSRETVPGLLPVAQMGLLHEFLITFENILLKRDLETGFETSLDPSDIGAIIGSVTLPLLISCGAVKEVNNGYITEYSSLEFDSVVQREEHRKFWQTRNFYGRKKKWSGPKFIFIKTGVKNTKRALFSR